MRRLQAHFQRSLWIGVLTLVSGCSDSGPKLDTAPVVGSVTRDGKPVAGALINFYPKAEMGKQAQTYTGDDGQYDVSVYVDTKNTQRGMLPGEYAVSIRQLDTDAVKTTRSAPKNLLPEKYASPETSELSATIVAGEENVRDFKLE